MVKTAQTGSALGITVALLGIAAVAGVGIAIVATREDEPAPPPEPEPEPVFDATLRQAYVWWAALTLWNQVYRSYLNTWPADTDLTFTFRIRNTGDTGAYFKAYMITPGAWLYLGPGEELDVEEDFHTPAIAPTPGYQYYRITILGRKISDEELGALWTSERIQVTYV